MDLLAQIRMAGDADIGKSLSGEECREVVTALSNLRAEVERLIEENIELRALEMGHDGANVKLKEQLRLAQIDNNNNNAETECAGWRTEALAARRVLHFFRVNYCLQSAPPETEAEIAYAAARAANEEPK